MKIWDIENNFYYKSDKSRINKVVSQFEIFKKSIKIKGAIVECGVFKGASLIRFLTFRSLIENSFSRKIIGFDTFGKFPVSRNLEDQRFIKTHLPKAGNAISIEELEDNKIIAHLNREKFRKISFPIFVQSEYLINYLKISGLKFELSSFLDNSNFKMLELDSLYR